MKEILHNLVVFRKSNMGNHVKVLREMVEEAEQKQFGFEMKLKLTRY